MGARVACFQSSLRFESRSEEIAVSACCEHWHHLRALQYPSTIAQSHVLNPTLTFVSLSQATCQHTLPNFFSRTGTPKYFVIADNYLPLHPNTLHRSQTVQLSDL